MSTWLVCARCSRAHRFAAVSAAVSMLVIGGMNVLPALAENYPAKPVRMVVPWPPGGANDIIGRELAEQMMRLFGQQVIVDNRGGPTE